MAIPKFCVDSKNYHFMNNPKLPKWLSRLHLMKDEAEEDAAPPYFVFYVTGMLHLNCMQNYAALAVL